MAIEGNHLSKRKSLGTQAHRDMNGQTDVWHRQATQSIIAYTSIHQGTNGSIILIRKTGY